MKTASWVIVCKSTGAAIMETFEENTARAINTEKYIAVPVREYLESMNRKLKEQQ